jgi:hypothetical protein
MVKFLYTELVQGKYSLQVNRRKLNRQVNKETGYWIFIPGSIYYNYVDSLLARDRASKLDGG